jgi:hypothetical protein
VTFFVLGEFRGSTLIYEEKLSGGIRIYSFFGFWAEVHVGMGGGGPFSVFIVNLGEF